MGGSAVLGSAGPPCLAGPSWGMVRLLTRVKSLDLQAAGFAPVASCCCGAGGGQHSGG